MPVPNLGGYEVQFASEPPDCLVCPICILVAKSPQQMDCCGRIYCQLCLIEHLKQSNKCPQCRTVGKSFNDKKSNREIQALKIKCTQIERGCDWVDELRLIDEHLKTCLYQRVQCPNACKEEEELTYILRRYLKKHISSMCPRRKHRCQYCQEEGEYEERMNGHLDTCPGVSVDCPNEGCNKRYPRRNASSHASICDYQRVPCKYVEVGCTEMPLRKDLKEHEENNALHLKTTIDTVVELKRDVEKLSQKRGHTIMVLCSKLKPKYNSPSFYCKNYKMRLQVDHHKISVYISLAKGKFDDSLQWPFQGIVTIELLNQLEDKNHFQRKVTFLPESSASQRVLDDIRIRRRGFEQFLTDSDIDDMHKKNCQFYVNNNLIFRVSVEIPDYKPWLECDQ